jgi:hypothetical protein
MAKLECFNTESFHLVLLAVMKILTLAFTREFQNTFVGYSITFETKIIINSKQNVEPSKIKSKNIEKRKENVSNLLRKATMTCDQATKLSQTM